MRRLNKESWRSRLGVWCPNDSESSKSIRLGDRRATILSQLKKVSLAIIVNPMRTDVEDDPLPPSRCSENTLFFRTVTN